MVADIEELENLESPSVSCRAVSVAILTDGVVGCSRVFLRIRLRGSPPLGPGDLVTVLPPGTRNIPQQLCYGLAKSKGARSIDEFISSASTARRPIPDFKNLDFKNASGLRKTLKRNFKKQGKVTTAQGLAQQETITYKQTDCLDGLVATKKPSWTKEICRKFICRATAFRHSAQSGTKYYQQSLTDLLTACWSVCTQCKLKNQKR